MIALSFNKAERLAVEAKARAAVSQIFGCETRRALLPVGRGPKTHEFDIFCAGVVVGGVTTAALRVGKGSSNTGGCDRAAAELLWLTLWQGPEQRIHVLTDEALASWLATRFEGAPFSRPIEIYHFEPDRDELRRMVELGI